MKSDIFRMTDSRKMARMLREERTYMKNMKLFRILSAVLILILCAALLTGCEEEADLSNRPNADTRTGKTKDLEDGDVSPEFTLTLLDGSTFRMSEHDDEIVLLNFWATWCGPCVKEMPDLQKLYREEIPGVTICCISIGDDAGTVGQFVMSNSLDLGFIGCAADTAIAEYYPTDYIPYTVLVVKGVVRETMVGSNSYDSYKRLINKYTE